MADEKWKDFLDAVFGDNLTEKDLEKMFLNNPSDAFAIYQLAENEKAHNYRFMPMAQLQAAGQTVDRANYEAVYTAALPDVQGKDLSTILEDTFYRFNMERPDDFFGHSLSVSDVVALKLNGAVTAHFVDSIGFQELHGFLSAQPLKNAEMQMEDGYGMIDGVLDNGKRNPDRERPSVVQQLRQPAMQLPKTPAKGKNEPSID